MAVTRTQRRRLLLGIFAAGIVLCPRAEADSPAQKHRLATVPQCTPAHIQDIRLPYPIAVDEVRVVVANHSPPTGEANIRVDLMLIWPVLLILTAWAFFRAFR